VLQRLNTEVFRQPRRVVENMRRVSDHVRARLEAGVPELGGRRWEMPRVLPSRTPGQHWVETEDGFWRMIGYVDASRSVETVAGPAQARELGTALGLFHGLISDLPPERLADTLPGFHVTPGYLDRFRAVLEARVTPLSEAERFGVDFVEARRNDVDVLERARDRGELRLRPIHGDPKISNVLMEADGTRAIALVDLDTVKPGLVHYDIGDCLRSGCNLLGEETADWQRVRFDLDLCEEILRGYLGLARGFLTAADRAYLYAAVRLIALELGIRFLTDHLEGDRYFRSRWRGHNLQRALVQFALTRSIEEQRQGITALVERLA
jgi:Ser/Thr protein kinase RdoA (MazF antagonist)